MGIKQCLTNRYELCPCAYATESISRQPIFRLSDLLVLPRHFYRVDDYDVDRLLLRCEFYAELLFESGEE
jgi:hypothetical protein